MDKVRYRGVSFHKHHGLYRAGFEVKDKDVNLGFYASPELAAYVVDFARYLIHGTNPAFWDARIGRPNAPPHNRDDFPRVVVLQRILHSGVIDPARLTERLAEFDAACG